MNFEVEAAEKGAPPKQHDMTFIYIFSMKKDKHFIFGRK